MARGARLTDAAVGGNPRRLEVGGEMSLDEKMAEGGQFAPSFRMGGLVRMLGIDLVIPFGGYYLARAVDIGVTPSLLISTVLAMVRLVWLAWRQRKVDAFAGFLLFLFSGGLTLSLITGDPRFLLLKSASLTVLSGLVFLGSVALRRPLTFAVARRLTIEDEQASAELTRGWEVSAAFRTGFYVMGLVWGVALVLSGAAQIWLILLLNLDKSVAVTNVLALTVFAVCGGWNVWFIEHARNLAARAAASPQPELV